MVEEFQGNYLKTARLACPESEDETHLLPLPLLVPIAEFDPADQCVGCGMSVLCDGKTRRILVDASKMFTKTFPQSAPSLADVKGRAAMAGDALHLFVLWSDLLHLLPSLPCPLHRRDWTHSEGTFW